MSENKLYTEDDLLSMERKELFQIAETLQLHTYPNTPTIKLVQGILDAQADKLEADDEELSEQGETEEEIIPTKEETQQVEIPDLDEEDPSNFDKANSGTVNLDAKQLIEAITAISNNRTNNSVAIKPTRELDTEEGRAAYKKARSEASRMVLIQLFKNNPRMRGERFVTFDVGNAVHSINWTIRVGKPWYVPESLVPFLQERSYQRLDMVDESEMIPRDLASGNAETKANFGLGIDREFTVSIIKRTGKTSAQLLDELSRKRMGNRQVAEDEAFGGLSL